MPRQHEIVALVNGRKAETERFVTELYKQEQKPDLFDGLQRTYRPAQENGDPLPPESKRPQLNAKSLITGAMKTWTELFDLILTMDVGNQSAKADLAVDGTVIVPDVPVSTLLFLEKQLANVRAFVEKIPTPDPAEEWVYDAAVGMLVTPAVETVRTKKVQEGVVLYPATKEHAAQTQLINKDVTDGYWKTVKQTTRIPADVKAAILDRVIILQGAVKVARERANVTEVTTRKMGRALFSYIFGDLAQ